MTPDDERHGTIAGYHGEGCRCEPCTTAARNYAKRRVASIDHGQPLTVPVVGFKRRIESLRALGWPTSIIAREMGLTAGALSGKITPQRHKVRIGTHERMCAVYDKLSMTLGPSESSRRRAAAKGWPVPLRWDEDAIDDPDGKPYQPRTKGAGPEPLEVDPVIVERALQGKRVRANDAERVEIVRLWLDTGRTRTALEDLQGWNVRSILRRTAA